MYNVENPDIELVWNSECCLGEMAERSGSLYNDPRTGYRFGFNGKESDTEGEWGDLTHYDYGFRIYNPGIARFLSADPLTNSYPMLTPYQFASNTPIQAIDLDGLESYVVVFDYTKASANGDPLIDVSFDYELEIPNDILVREKHQSVVTDYYASYSEFPEYFPNFSQGIFTDRYKQRADERGWLSVEGFGAVNMGYAGYETVIGGIQMGAGASINAIEFLKLGAVIDSKNGISNNSNWPSGIKSSKTGVSAAYVVGVEYYKGNNLNGYSPEIIKYSGGIANIEWDTKTGEGALTWDLGAKGGLYIIGGKVEVSVRLNLKKEVKYTAEEKLYQDYLNYNRNKSNDTLKP